MQKIVEKNSTDQPQSKVYIPSFNYYGRRKGAQC